MREVAGKDAAKKTERKKNLGISRLRPVFVFVFHLCEHNSNPGIAAQSTRKHAHDSLGRLRAFSKHAHNELWSVLQFVKLYRQPCRMRRLWLCPCGATFAAGEVVLQ